MTLHFLISDWEGVKMDVSDGGEFHICVRFKCGIKNRISGIVKAEVNDFTFHVLRLERCENAGFCL